MKTHEPVEASNSAHSIDLPAKAETSPRANQGTEIVGDLARAAAMFREAAELLEPTFLVFAEAFQHAQHVFDEWEQRAPSVLKDAIAARGLIVPLSRMSFDDLLVLVTLHPDGDQGVVDKILEHYDQIFAAPFFTEVLVASWASNRYIARRLRILEQAIKAHDLGMYEVSVPTLIAQFEGLIADITGHTGPMSVGDVMRHATELAGDDSVTSPMFTSFVNDTLFQKFFHGSTVPAFSRHAILHGADIGYGTVERSRTAILLIDQLRELTELAPQGRESGTPPPRTPRPDDTRGSDGSPGRG